VVWRTAQLAAERTMAEACAKASVQVAGLGMAVGTQPRAETAVEDLDAAGGTGGERAAYDRTRSEVAA
jgi:hypothetical protein